MLSIDHEILTMSGWKYPKQLKKNEEIISVKDDIFTQVNIDNINIVDYNGPMINIQDSRLNIFGTPDLKIICQHRNQTHYYSLYHCASNDVIIKVIYESCNDKFDKYTKSINDINTKMTIGILSGSCPVINIMRKFNQDVYEIIEHYTDIKKDKKTDTIFLPQSYGSVFNIECKTPICTRRHGKVSWVMFS